jgi:LysM repeat protein
VDQILQDGHAYVAPSNLPPYCLVDPGDTLGGIAVQYGVSLDYILSRNPGINADLIFPGQRINL